MSRYSSARIFLQTAALLGAFACGWTCRPQHGPVAAQIRAAAPPRAHGGIVTGSTSGLNQNPADARRSRTGMGAEAAEAAPDFSATLQHLRAMHLPGAAADPLQKLQRLADLAKADPMSALTYVDTLPAAERDAAAATVMSTWARVAPAEAAAHLETESAGFGLSESAARASAGSLAAAWAERDPHAAAAWAAQLPDELRPAALQAAAARIAGGSPEQALTLFSSLPDSALRIEAAAPIAASWAAADPVATAAWALSLSTPGEQAAALTGLTAAWMQRDPDAASRWVNALPQGSGKDAAIQALAASPAIRNDLDASLAWAQSMQPGAARDQLLSNLNGRVRLRATLR